MCSVDYVPLVSLQMSHPQSLLGHPQSLLGLPHLVVPRDGDETVQAAPFLSRAVLTGREGQGERAL